MGCYQTSGRLSVDQTNEQFDLLTLNFSIFMFTPQLATPPLGTDGYNPEEPSLTAGTNIPPPLIPQMPLRPAFPPPPLPPGIPPLPPLHARLSNTVMHSAFVPVGTQATPIAPPMSRYV